MTECSYYISQPRSRADPARLGRLRAARTRRAAARSRRRWREVAVGEEGMLCIPRTDPGAAAALLEPARGDGRVRSTATGSSPATTRAATPTATSGSSAARDDLINTFGYRVSPHEVERVLKDHPDVADCAAVGEEVGAEQDRRRRVRRRRARAARSRADDVLAYARAAPRRRTRRRASSTWSTTCRARATARCCAARCGRRAEA